MQAALTPPPFSGGRREGGALGSVHRGSGSLSEQETHILQYLGSAVLLRWNELPTQISVSSSNMPSPTSNLVRL
jgi:hypothetical protein